MKNAWVDEVRGRIRRGRIMAPEEAGEPVGDGSAGAWQQRMAIQAAMSMPPVDRRVVTGLVPVDALPCKEAADVLEIPMGTLISRLARARETLQGLLSDQARTV
jgi:DNA-directed RNA polymerase specialized sigma24 family protein